MVGERVVVFADLGDQVHVIMLDLEAAHSLQVLRVLADVPHVHGLLLWVLLIALKVKFLRGRLRRVNH